MICPECAEEGKTSIVYVGPGTVTLTYSQPFYDEQGRYHDHDSNTSTYEYSCSNGHKWVERRRPGKCWCGWPDVDQQAKEVVGE